MTNFERIKAMTVEEMATLLFALRDTTPEYWGREKMLKWLENEVQEDDR